MLRRRRQELMSEIKQAQDGEANTQINGDGNSITNMIGNVKVSPKGIELKAVVDHFWLSFFIIAAICVLVISTTIYFQLRSLGNFSRCDHRRSYGNILGVRNHEHHA